MTKKAISILVTTLSITLLLTACGGGDSGSDSIPDSNNPELPELPDIEAGVLSSVNGLMWQDATNYISWQDAKTHCENLEWAEHSDWRVPSMDELFRDYENIDFVYSSWSSNEVDEDTARFFYNVNNSPVSSKRSKTDIEAISCVRGTLSVEELTVVDPTTNIQWQDSTQNAYLTHSWQEAVDYCENLVYAQKSDWGLPSKEAMQTIDSSNSSTIYEQLTYGSIYVDYWTSSKESTNNAYVVPNDPTFGGLYSPEITEQYPAICIRGGDFSEDTMLQYYGRWAYVDNSEVINIDEHTYLKDYAIVDDNHIKVGSRHLVRAGIADVKLTGEIATLIDSPSTSPARASGLNGVGGMNLIIKNLYTSIEKNITVEPTDDSSLLGKVVDDTLYVSDPTTTDDKIIIPRNSELTMPTGDTEITIIENDINATFNVSVIGEETDMGILTVTDKAYNFKSYINNENDWRYFGYNDGETPITYAKELNICNIGTADISGVSFEIALDTNATDLNRTFSTDYDGSAVPFTSGECKTYNASFSFTRPLEDRDVKINITINDNFNALTWNDYAAIKVSQYPHHNLYFNSNTKTLNGFLVAPGRNLINVEFSNSSYNNFVRVPLVQTDKYDVIISTPDITDEDVYMISSGVVPDTTKMNGFTNVMANEPDNNQDSATKLALFKGESVAYLAKSDIDFYQIVDKPKVLNMVANAYVDLNISIPFTTDLNESTVSNATVTLSNLSGTVTGVVSYDNASKTIYFDPSSNLSAGDYTVTLSKDLQSATGYYLNEDVSWTIKVMDYPTSAQIVSTQKLSNDGMSVVTAGNYAYVAAKRAGLQIIDVTDPTVPKLSATLNTSSAGASSAVGITVSGDFAYLTDTEEGVHIIDISDPTDPKLTATLDTFGQATAVAVSGSFAYIADGNNAGLKIIDISNPSAPKLTASFNPSNTTDGYGIAIAGNYAYLASDNGLQIIDVTDPTTPKLAATFGTTTAYGVSILGNIAYVSGFHIGLQVIDISDPNTPTLISNLETLGDAKDVTISGNFAYLADGSEGLQVIDISNPTTPKLITTLNTSEIGSAYDIVVSGNFAYVADFDYALHIINIQMYK